MTAGIRAWFAARRQRNTNARKYAVHERRQRVLLGELRHAADAQHRAGLLLNLATATQRIANLHNQVHGIEWIEEEDRSTATSLMLEAGLYRALCDVELAVAHGVTRVRAVGCVEQVAADVLDRMAASPNLAGRVRLLDELRTAVLPAVGVQAAEALVCLPSPAGTLAAVK